MSHFTVLVSAENETELEKLLLPYHEYECTGIEKFLEFEDNTDEIIKEWEEETQLGIRMDNGEVISKYDKRFQWKQKAEGKNHQTARQVAPDGKEFEEISYKEFYPTLEEFAKDYHGYDVREDGRIGRMTNPNSKWDWWVIGGRWSGTLVMKEDFEGQINLGHPGVFGHGKWDDNRVRSSSALVKDIDLKGMKNSKIEGLRKQFQDFHSFLKDIPEKELSDEEIARRRDNYKKWSERNEKVAKLFSSFEEFLPISLAMEKIDMGMFIGTDEYDSLISSTEEEYCVPPALTYAFVDTEGQWNQRGEMGWWGMDNPDKGTQNYNEAWWIFVNSLKPDTNLYVIDCHI